MGKRILWLSNNRIYRKAEADIFCEMGYEVYMPKTGHFNNDLSFDNVNYEYDKYLSIEKKDIDYLNSIDLWAVSELRSSIQLINQYFDFVIFPFEAELIDVFLHAYKGKALCRVYDGIGSEEMIEAIRTYCPTFFKDIDNNHHRFRFVMQYEETVEKNSWVKKHAVFIPMALDNERFSWNGGDEFIYWEPNIEINSENRKQYENFKKDFHDMCYSIGGEQLIEIVDKQHQILNYEQLIEKISRCSAVVYMPESKNSLDYFILKVIQSGIPVIYNSKSLLDKLISHKTDGQIKDNKDFRKIIEALNKSSLTKNIVEAESEVIHRNNRGICKNLWFSLLSSFSFEEHSDVKDIKLALVMPNNYTGGVLDFTKRLALAINEANKSDLSLRIKTVIYYPEHEVFDEQDYFEDVRQAGIDVRSFKWQEKDRAWIANYFLLQDLPDDKKMKKLFFIEDGMSNLHEFDYVIFTADFAPMPYYIPVRYSVVVHDVIQRNIAMGNKTFEGYRQFCIRRAERVIATTEPMMKQVMSYIGIVQDRMVYMPQMLEAIDINNKLAASEEEYFLWATNTAKHKNHITALNALEEYYINGGSMKCCITGAAVKKLDPDYEISEAETYGYLSTVRKKIQNSNILKANLVFMGNLPKKDYFNLLQNAAFTFHPGYADNGNVVDAVQLKVPALSSDYPAMRFMNERMNLNCTFCKWDDYKSITNGLFYMEAHYRELKGRLNESEFYHKFTWQGQKNEIYNIVKSMISGL